MKDPWETFLAAKREARAQTLETRRRNERRRRAEAREAFQAREVLLAEARRRFGQAGSEGAPEPGWDGKGSGS